MRRNPMSAITSRAANGRRSPGVESIGVAGVVSTWVRASSTGAGSVGTLSVLFSVVCEVKVGVFLPVDCGH
jgi:hypothetical protein